MSVTVSYNMAKSLVCVMGLGYVGRPLAQAFSKSLKVIGFDVDGNKVKELKQGNNNHSLILTDTPKDIRQADFFVICVPTPVSKSGEIDLSHVKSAARIISQNMKKGNVIILESTVYPGVTEEVVRPILEESGLKCGRDFKLAYSPERVNPGDTEHAVDKVTKIVSGIDEETTDIVAELYSLIVPGVFRAKDIKTAETAKIVENIQRNLNIALVNELALICQRLGLSTRDVLEAAASKWNFHRYTPGLVGGYCIPVAPYYLAHKAHEVGYHPQLILAGIAINDYMPRHVAKMTISALNSAGKLIKGSQVLIMGLTFKENVADTRDSPAKEIIRELREYGIDLSGYDPLLSLEQVREFGIRAVANLGEAQFDGVIAAVAHDAFKRISMDKLRKAMKNQPVLIDVRGMFEPKVAQRLFSYRTL